MIQYPRPVVPSRGIALAVLLVFTSLTLSPSRAEDAASATGKGTSERVSGIDTSLLSETVTPEQDFYQYANDGWLESTEIPADRSDYGVFSILDDKTKQQVRELIQAAADQTDAVRGTATQKVGDLQRSFLDVEGRNARGIEPIRGMLQQVSKIDSLSTMGTVLGELERFGVGHLFGSYVSVDARNSDAYTVYVTQSGLTLPDRDYYMKDEPRYEKLREELVQYAADMLQRIGHDQPQQAAEQILKLETAIAEAQWTKSENRDPVKTYNKKTADEMAEILSAWPSYAAATEFDKSDAFVLRQPSFFSDINDLLKKHPLNTWKDYLAFKVVDAYASSLTEALEKRHFDFHGTAVTGVTEQKPMWRRGVELTGSVLGELVGELYVEKHFKPAAKRRMGEMVENLKKAFAQRIETLTWMGPGTKKQALEKLGQFTTKIGYPDVWKDYTKLSIGDSLPDNLMAAAAFEHQRMLDKLGGPIDRNEWHMTPQTINAYYNPTMNEIVFPAAILQPPFFNMAADDAVNYGGIGAVIGHELSHGFDDKGSQYDGAGNLRDWWTPEDREEFEKRAQGLVEQYNNFQPLEDMSVNGEMTLGENIGDLGGLNVAYHAYQLSLDGKPAPVIDGLTGDQRFFLGWAQVWRRLYREPELRRRLLVDYHSPSRYRVNGIVWNMDAFYEAFDIPKDSPMYLPKEERVRIW
ncbi:M13 family metallopeptidase [Roseimaritima sediminicola]|uniref:M13 family metallopeptidase n=1 Tax=Roseimaritima sediminicola TaxID=2662066 RepID=UPI0012984184|nr:M13 family metallopeptidase [Roseimaritima sediminicola]